MKRVSGIKAAGLLAALGSGSDGGKKKPRPVFRLATIPPGYAGGRPRLIFDGETAAGTRQYPKLKDVVLAAGDRVLVAMHDNSGTVIGVIE